MIEVFLFAAQQPELPPKPSAAIVRAWDGMDVMTSEGISIGGFVPTEPMERPEAESHTPEAAQDVTPAVALQRQIVSGYVPTQPALSGSVHPFPVW